MQTDRIGLHAERIRAFAASVDGSILDDATWAYRHRWISAVGWMLAVVCLGLAPVFHGDKTWVYVGVMFAAMIVAGSDSAGRRAREVAVVLNFLVAQLYVNAFIGNLLLGPIEIIILTFYQDWVPIVAGCVAAVAVVLLGALDPAYVAATKGFEAQDPLSGAAFRATSVVLAAGLTVFVWRAGTLFARDPLTGMLSRAGVARLIDRQIRRGNAPAVWTCDIDGFKTINSELGPTVGDQVLRHVAAAVQHAGRSLAGPWFCGRLDADTFVIASRDASDLSFVESFAHQLEQDVGIPYSLGAGDHVPVRVSVGATVAVPGDSGHALLRAAEQNMREAKSRGQSRVLVDPRTPRSIGTKPSLLIAELYRACDVGELELHLQPIVRVSDGVPVGAETLVRWNHPQRGVVFPGDFLREAERDSALMAKVADTLGRQFMQLTSDLIGRHGREWLQYGFSYNLAPIRLRDPMVVTSTVQVMSKFGMDNAGWLCTFEVTEGALVEIERGESEVLASLRNLGFRIALDDFGTGYSSLAQLPNLPLDSVKIDKTFVHSLGQSPTHTAVVRAVSDIASAAGLTVVAEGVETTTQCDLLMSINPEMMAQGWLYAPAMPVAEFEAWVADSKLARSE